MSDKAKYQIKDAVVIIDGNPFDATTLGWMVSRSEPMIFGIDYAEGKDKSVVVERKVK